MIIIIIKNSQYQYVVISINIKYNIQYTAYSWKYVPNGILRVGSKNLYFSLGVLK